MTKLYKVQIVRIEDDVVLKEFDCEGMWESGGNVYIVHKFELPNEGEVHREKTILRLALGTMIRDVRRAAETLPETPCPHCGRLTADTPLDYGGVRRRCRYCYMEFQPAIPVGADPSKR